MSFKSNTSLLRNKSKPQTFDRHFGLALHHTKLVGSLDGVSAGILEEHFRNEQEALLVQGCDLEITRGLDLLTLTEPLYFWGGEALE